MLRHHYNSESSEGILSDGERVLGEVRTTLPDSLIKEPVSASKNVSRKGGKVKRSKPKLVKGERGDHGSDNSSLCANSELSNISDESLPSDMEEVEVDDDDDEDMDEGEGGAKHKHRAAAHHHHHQHAHHHHHHHHHHHSAHHHHHHKGDGDHDTSDSEMEEEEYSESSEEQEEDEEIIQLDDGMDEEEFAELQVKLSFS